jgi:hypothetical protein
MRNKADRVAAERAAEQRATDKARAASAADRTSSEIASLGEAAARLIPQVLTALAARDYEGIEEISSDGPRGRAGRLLGIYKERRTGAYRISAYSHPGSNIRPAGTDYVRLLSDGNLAVGNGRLSLDEFVQEARNGEGLGKRGAALPAFSLAGLRNFVLGLEDLLTDRK